MKVKVSTNARAMSYSCKTYVNEEGLKCQELTISHNSNKKEIQIFVDKNNDNKFDFSERVSTTIHYLKNSLCMNPERYYYDSNNDGIAHLRVELLGKYYELPIGNSEKITNINL